jgi:predicted nucleic acid-binding protein
MTVYVDSSVLLRIVLGEPGPLRSWTRITRAVSSELIRLECLRTIDRARIRERLPDREVAARRAAVLEQLDAFDLVRIDGRVLGRAADPFSTLIGSLDAIHLTSALLARERLPRLSRFATHDASLALAARAVGFDVVGAD